ncbi:MAG: hypothetical protein LBT86_03805 [Deltaproteobacteria bacterium]|jgi:shikimate kinase/3-dehydroquinate synthase|nr:hypothetical protein [Deltaproteobacteria bacterium]
MTDLNFDYNPHQAPRSLERVIVLIGFMGAGKTTVGRLLSQILHRPLVDLDEALEERLGLTIPEIFSQKGEEYFRTQETLLLNELTRSQEPRILSAGGGVVERPRNIHILSFVKTYYLKAPVADLWARLQGPERAHRPLAQDKAGFWARFENRAPWYESAGEVVDATGQPEHVARNIAQSFLGEDAFTLSAEGKTTKILTLEPEPIGPIDHIDPIDPTDPTAPAHRPRLLRAPALSQKKILLLLDRAFLQEEAIWRKALPQALIYFPQAQGEAAKTLTEAEALLTFMAENGLDRSDYLLAKGGGALTDLGGLVASLYKRGLNLILWPTTLLGAVDAAIGGKTAVNLAGAKNQVGHFYLPRQVWLDPQTLAYLPRPLLAEGLVEALKTGLLFDPKLYDLIERDLERLLNGDGPLILEVARRSAWAKARLVEKDFREKKGLRDVLNLGHTYGHVLESHHGPKLSHGRAVAFGLAVALEVSLAFGLAPQLARQAQNLCRRLAGELPALPPPAEAKRLLTFDKKIRDGKLKFVLLKAIGAPQVEPDFKPELALSVASRLYASFEGEG